MSVRLNDTDRAVLAGFRALDPKGEYQFNYWAPALEAAVKSAATDLGLDYPPVMPRDLTGLVRRRLLDAQGKGKFRQFWITPKGLEALDAT